MYSYNENTTCQPTHDEMLLGTNFQETTNASGHFVYEEMMPERLNSIEVVLNTQSFARVHSVRLFTVMRVY